MKKPVWLYLVVAAVFIGSYALATVFPAGSLLQQMAGNTGIVALLAALWQSIRDATAHERQVMLQRDEQTFRVGTTSHMANTVFDKHVIFCEEYFREVNATIMTLYREHATPIAMDHANKLAAIRRDHGAWLTVRMSEDLSAFEQQLRRLGAQAGFLRDTHGQPEYAEQRQKMVGEIYAAFSKIVPVPGHDIDGDFTNAASADLVLRKVREMLEIERLVSLRTALIARAHQEIVDVMP